MSLKTVVVTGANAGLGFAISTAMAKRGYRVVMACRNQQKAEAALRLLLSENPGANAVLMSLDLSKLASVKAFVEQFRSEIGTLELLINNAGIALVPQSRTDQGFEMHLATNYLGAFALIGRMLPLFNTDGSARIVNVGSLAHRTTRLNLDDINWEKEEYNEWRAYARSKLAMQMFTLELDRRLVQHQLPIIALGAHPGFANTEISKASKRFQSSGPIRNLTKTHMLKILPTTSEAAQAIILAATSPDARGGDYYGPTGFLEIKGRPGKARINRKAKDKAMAQRLWKMSEAMTGVSFLD